MVARADRYGNEVDVIAVFAVEQILMEAVPGVVVGGCDDGAGRQTVLGIGDLAAADELVDDLRDPGRILRACVYQCREQVGLGAYLIDEALAVVAGRDVKNSGEQDGDQ